MRWRSAARLQLRTVIERKIASKVGQAAIVANIPHNRTRSVAGDHFEL